MQIELSDTYGNTFYNFLLLLSDILNDSKNRRKIIIGLIVITGVYLVITNDGDVVSEQVFFYGHNIQGYGFFTTATFTVCTDSDNIELTEFDVYHYSLGTWKPSFEYKDESKWYTITYQKTLIGYKLLKVEPT